MQLTVLFTDICGSTLLSASVELEHFDRILDLFFEICGSTAERHGGQLTRGEGDGSIIVFGLPEPIEDQGRRAAEAALEIHQKINDIARSDIAAEFSRRSLPIEVHSGIHGGILLVAPGRVKRDATDLVGGVANIAKKLAAEAEPGQVVASRSALGPYKGFFEHSDHCGKDPALPRAHVLAGRGNVRRRFDVSVQRGLSPLSGREEALAYLTRFAHRRLGEDSRCVVVVADAGYGKTRLLEELSVRLQRSGPFLLRGTCEGYLGSEVLQPFVQMLRAMSTSLPEGIAENPASRFMYSLGKRSEDTSVLLIIDDWQWADDASRQLLEAVLRLPAGPIVLLAARRRPDGSNWISDAPHIELQPLSKVDSALTVKTWLPDSNPFVADEIHAYAGGVPLFIEEFCIAARDGDRWRPSETGGSIQAWVASLVASRTNRLPREDRDLLQASAVIGSVAPLWLLELLCDGPVASSAPRLANADLMYLDERCDSLRFKHGFTRDAIYERMSLDVRTKLHERIVRCLEQRSSAAQDADSLQALAYHTQKAGNWGASARYAEQAGDRAMAAFALDRARSQYLAAMSSIDRLEPTPENLRRWCLDSNKLGMACIFDPLSLDGGLRHFERAVTLAVQLNDLLLLARSKYWLGYICYGFGHFRIGVIHLRQALVLLEQQRDERLSAQVKAALGQALAACCEYDEALALLDEAVDAKRHLSKPGGSLAIGSAYSLACKASVLGDRGDFEGAHSCCDQAISLLGESMHPVANSVRNWICLVNIWQGRWEAATAIAAQSARIAENTKALLLLAACKSMAGFVRWSDRNDPAGLQQMREAVRWMDSRNGGFYTSLHYGWLIEACVEGGLVDEARRYAARLLRRARQGDRLGEAAGCRAMAVERATAGDRRVAERWLGRAEASARVRKSSREAALNRAARARVDHIRHR